MLMLQMYNCSPARPVSPGQARPTTTGRATPTPTTTREAYKLNHFGLQGGCGRRSFAAGALSCCRPRNVNNNNNNNTREKCCRCLLFGLSLGRCRQSCLSELNSTQLNSTLLARKWNRKTDKGGWCSSPTDRPTDRRAQRESQTPEKPPKFISKWRSNRGAALFLSVVVLLSQVLLGARVFYLNQNKSLLQLCLHSTLDSLNKHTRRAHSSR